MSLNFCIMDDPPVVTMFDDTTDFAFGPVLYGAAGMERLAAFLRALGEDPRTLTPWALEFAWAAWSAANPADDDAKPDFDTAANPDTDDDGAPPDLPARTEPVGGYTDSGDWPAPGESTGEQAPAREPAPTADERPATEQAPPADSPSNPTPEPVKPPVGARECWNCGGTRVEPDGTGNACGICVGKGYLNP